MTDDVKTIEKCLYVILNKFDYEKKVLDLKQLKEVKTIVRRNEAIIPAFVDALFQRLRSNNSDARLGCLLLTNYFFQRSHKFRVDIINSLQDFVLLTLETDPIRYPLPEPTAAALSLKKETLEIIRCWIEKFAPGYPKLCNAKEFLKTSKNFDFEYSNANLLVERNRIDQELFTKQVLAKKRFEKFQKLFNDNFNDIQKCLIECRNLLELLLPKFSDDIPSSMKAQSSGEITNQLHGYSNDSVINIVIPSGGIKLTTNCNNADLLITLNDCKKQLNVYLIKVLKWLKKLSQIDLPNISNINCNSEQSTTGTASISSLMKRLIDVKNDLSCEIERCAEISCNENSKVGYDKEVFDKKLAAAMEETNSAESGSDDEEFVDVEEKEGLELDFVSPSTSATDPVPTYILTHLQKCHNKFEDQPGPSGLNSTQKNQCTGDAQSKGAMAKKLNTTSSVPKLSFGLDLKYWGKKVEPAELVNNNSDGHRFWRPSDTTPSTESEEAYTARLITFIGETPVIKRMCRAPLPSGKLCPRMDRERCPIHGLIVARDSMGFPIAEINNSKEKDIEAIKSTKNNNEKVLGDENFLRDIEGAIGIELGSQKKNKRHDGSLAAARKRKTPESVALRNRLSAKLFDKRTLKRVTQTITDMQKARAERKFSHQFNYALNKR